MPQDQDAHQQVPERQGHLPYATGAVFGTIMINCLGNLTGRVRL